MPRSIERVLRLDDNHIDLATAALLVSQHWNPDLHIIKYRDKDRRDGMGY